nr:type II toxin-antitoxin system PemK/MazF family toxin [Microcystis aeruginosa]
MCLSKWLPFLTFLLSSLSISTYYKGEMLPITTATHSSWLLDVRITNLQAAGLKTPSIVRMKLFTLEHSLIVKRIGKLTVNDRSIVEKALKQLLKLN